MRPSAPAKAHVVGDTHEPRECCARFASQRGVLLPVVINVLHTPGVKDHFVQPGVTDDEITPMTQHAEWKPGSGQLTNGQDQFLTPARLDHAESRPTDTQRRPGSEIRSLMNEQLVPQGVGQVHRHHQLP